MSFPALAQTKICLWIWFQFFITLGDDLDYLDGQHTVFAEVVEGFDVLDKLNDAICDDEHRPYQDIR